MAHRLEEDLLERIAPVRELPHQQILPRGESPDGIDLDSRRQHDTPAAAAFGHAFGADLRQGVEIDLRSHDLPPLSPDISLCLFRVLQEALHNSAKHSGVRRVEVRLWGEPDEIHLTVSDSGTGFDSEAAKEGRGLGLISMKERLNLVNGSLSIDSQPESGTTIHARVPVSSGHDSMRAAG